MLYSFKADPVENRELIAAVVLVGCIGVEVDAGTAVLPVLAEPEGVGL